MKQQVKPIGPDAVHVCVDVQRLFAEETDWHTPSIPGILPQIVRLTEHAPSRSIFTRFTTPEHADDAVGHWRVYYERWTSVTTAVMDAAMIDVVDTLASFVPPALVADKPTYSIFKTEAFRTMLHDMSCRTLICTGVETDVCVLGTVMDAMDYGYRVVIPSDAVHSSNPASHAATMDHVYRRFEDQIEIGTTDEVLAHWTVS